MGTTHIKDAVSGNQLVVNDDGSINVTSVMGSESVEPNLGVPAGTPSGGQTVHIKSATGANQLVVNSDGSINVVGGVAPTGTPNHWAAFDAGGDLAALANWHVQADALHAEGWLATQAVTTSPDAGSPTRYGINAILGVIDNSEVTVNNMPYLWRLGIAYDEQGNNQDMGEFGMWYGQTVFDGGGNVTTMNGFYMVHTLPGDGTGGVITNHNILTATATFSQLVSATHSTGLTVSQIFDATNTVGALTGILINDTVPAGVVPSVSNNAIAVTSTQGFTLSGDLPMAALSDQRVFTGSIAGASTYGQFTALSDLRTFQSGSAISPLTSVLLAPTCNENAGGIYYGLVVSPAFAHTPDQFFGIQVDGPSTTTSFAPVGLSLSGCNINAQGVFRQGQGYDGQAAIHELDCNFSGTFSAYGSPITGLLVYYSQALDANQTSSTTSIEAVIISLPQDVITVAEINLFKASGWLNSHVGDPATWTDVTQFYAKGFTSPSGQVGTITNQYGFRMEESSGNTITNYWGVYINSTAADNYFGKSIAIATGSKKVTNASVALEIGGATQALRVSSMTTTEKNALTPLAGMVVFDSVLVKLSYYTGAVWVNL